MKKTNFLTVDEKSNRWKIQRFWLWFLKLLHFSWLWLFSCCDTDVQFSWVRCWWAWGCSIFLRNIQPDYLSTCRSLSEVYSTLSIVLAFWTWQICACSGQIALQVKSGVIIHRIEQSSTSIDEGFTTRALSRLLGLNIAGYVAKMQRFRFGYTKHITKTPFGLVKVS